MTQAKAAANAAKAAKERADALAEQLKQADAAQAALKESNQKLIDARSAAEAKARDAEAGVARMKDQLQKAGLDGQATRDALAKAEASGKQAAAFVAAVAQRLRTAPTRRGQRHAQRP